MQINYYPAN
ncbi:uncharacterized protein FFE2_16072 [Fusarium fujikuroi]|nr:uncharacterized protein FFE2_16072 [Fusarium fujikuroi]SCV61453.1 uncharacterized protein FFFS_16023 [Fusarium fujikuroi]